MTSQSALEIRRSHTGGEAQRGGRGDGAGPDAASGWSLVREIGIEYAEPAHDRAEPRLQHPVLIEPAGARRHLIVDEIGLEKARTVRIECRTLVVDDR